MEPSQLAKLPIIFQVIAGFGLFFGTFMLAIGGWLWKTVKKKWPESIAALGEPETKDVVIQSAAIADTQAIKALAGAIDRLIEFLKQDSEDDNHQLRRNHSVLCEIRDNIETLSKHMKGRTIM